MTKRAQYISDPPETCDLCHAPIANVFIDAALRLQGRLIWGNVCQSCHQQHGIGLGTGKGQEWWLDPESGKFYKIEG